MRCNRCRMTFLDGRPKNLPCTNRDHNMRCPECTRRFSEMEYSAGSKRVVAVWVDTEDPHLFMPILTNVPRQKADNFIHLLPIDTSLPASVQAEPAGAPSGEGV